MRESKYANLGKHLQKQPFERVPMTFREIEQITGTPLPPKAQNYPAWWSNNPSNNVMTKVWLDAGFRTEQVDVPARKLVFRRTKDVIQNLEPLRLHNKSTDDDSIHPVVRHPLFGALKGLIRVPPDVDLTQPADPEWGQDDDN